MDHYTDTGWITLYILVYCMMNHLMYRVYVWVIIGYTLLYVQSISYTVCLNTNTKTKKYKHQHKYKEYKEIETPTQFQILRNIARSIIDLFLCIWDNNVWREYNVV